MKKLEFVFIYNTFIIDTLKRHCAFGLILLSNSIFSQDSLISSITLKNIVPLDSNFIKETKIKKNHINIYGEYHDYKDADKLATSFFTKLNVNSSRKIYFVEGGASFAYMIDKCNQNRKYLNYKWGASIILDKDPNLKKSFLYYNQLYTSDSSVKFIGYDCEISFNYSLLCLYDILKSSKTQEVFNVETTYFNKNFRFFYKNKRLTKLCLFYINSYLNDSIKYKTNITSTDFNYYIEIIQGLRVGLLDDSIQKTQLNFYEKHEYRESYLYNNISSTIDKYNPDLVFIQAGLLHALDTFIYSTHKLPWVSVTERLSTKYGKDNVTKTCLIRLSDVRKYNHTIYNLYVIDYMNKIKKLKDTFIDLEYLRPYIKTKFDYAVFIE